MTTTPIRASLPTAGESWRHWKGGLYRIVGLAYDVRDCDMVVLYQARDDGPLWIRPLGNFLGLAMADKPRFAFERPARELVAQTATATGTHELTDREEA